MSSSSLSSAEIQSLRAAFEQVQDGHALPQRFYMDELVFKADIELLKKHWFCVGTRWQLPRRGDYFSFEFGSDSIIVIRTDSDTIQAFHNVCRHRGSRLVTSEPGHCAAFICPYHGWRYDLSGQLTTARQMPESFSKQENNLVPVHVVEIHGLIFVCLADSPPDLSTVRTALSSLGEVYGWQNASLAVRKTYRVAANWKLVVENYHECYHCAPAHPEFSVLHGLAEPPTQRAAAEQQLRTADAKRGINIADFEHWPKIDDQQELARTIRSNLRAGYQTGSKDGAPLAPLMGALKSYDAACAFYEAGPLSAFLAYADYGVIYRFIPRDTLLTEMEVIWLVAPAAQAGRDYDMDKLTWLWDVTSVADKKIIEMNHAGVRSSAYRPGHYSLMERGTRIYSERYRTELAQYLTHD